MFNLPKLFTKKQWKDKIEENDVIVKDIDILINLFLEKEILETTDGKLFKITVYKAFYNEQSFTANR